MNLQHLMKFARHSKVEMTMRYLHVGAEELRAAVSRMPVVPAASAEARTVTGAAEAVSSDQKSDQTDHLRTDTLSSVVTNPRSRKTAQPSGKPEGCAVFSQRGRRGSNPQPPDRQSGTLTN
jgi:hypothetical protein